MVQLSQEIEGLKTPPEIVCQLDRAVIGQVEAKRALALAGYRHYLGTRMGSPRGEPHFGRQHIMLTGPTGCGKSKLVAQLGKIFKRPMVTVAATNLVEAGYTGEHVDGAVARLLLAAGGDVKIAERGIIFVDEVDKIRRVETSGRDVSGEGVQNALLKILDGVEVPVQQKERKVMVDTSRIFFVFAGAFDGLAEIAKRRACGPVEIGFGRTHDASPGRQPESRVEDLIEYGMLREFVGRLVAIAPVRPLDRLLMKRILVEPDDSVIRRARDFFLAHGVDLNVSDSGLAALADRAAEFGTGARALERVAAEVIEPVLWRMFESPRRVSRIDLTGDSVRGFARARFHYRPGRVNPRQNELWQEAPVRTEPGDWEGPTHTAAWYHRELKRLFPEIGFDDASELAQDWWADLVCGEDDRMAVLYYVACQVIEKEATLEDLFTAYQEAGSTNPVAVLHYLDYLRARSG